MEKQTYSIDLEYIAPVIGKQKSMYNHHVQIEKQSEKISNICYGLNNMTNLIIGWIKKIGPMNLKNKKTSNVCRRQTFVFRTSIKYGK